MIELLYMILSFILLWIPTFILHEVCHSIEGRRQGCRTKIQIWWHGKIPSMRCIVTEGTLKNTQMMNLSGGAYSGLIMLFLSVCFVAFIPWLAVAIGVLGVINITYSFYEMIYLGKIPLAEYMKYHYYVYLAGGFIGLFMYSIIIGEMIW